MYLVNAFVLESVLELDYSRYWRCDCWFFYGLLREFLPRVFSFSAVQPYLYLLLKFVFFAEICRGFECPIHVTATSYCYFTFIPPGAGKILALLVMTSFLPPPPLPPSVFVV
jgi:hypothetical protein